MRKLLIAVLGLLATAASATPLPPPPPPAPPPKLLIAISVDQLSSDLFERYRPHFTGGLERLARGTVFTNAIGVTAGTGGNIGTLIQQQLPRSLNLVVAGDRPAAVAFGGADPNQRWYWNGSHFSTDLAKPAPSTVARANAAVASMIGTAQAPLVPPPACPAATTPPGAAGRFGRAAGDAEAYSRSPALDAAVLALSAALSLELRLGADAVPDILSIGLPATGRVAQRFGPASESTCLQLLSLDRDLGDFFALLDRSGMVYAVVLSGAAGSSAAPPRVPILFWRRGMAAADRDQAVATTDIAPTIAAMLALPAPADIGGNCLQGIQGVACPVR